MANNSSVGGNRKTENNLFALLNVAGFILVLILGRAIQRKREQR